MEYSEVTQSVISYTEQHLLGDLELEHFQELTGYSKYHLLRVFKKETGKTIGEYIRNRRLAVAANLLIDSNETIITIAFALGFNSQEAFSRAFKEIYAFPPGQYRRMMKTMRVEREMNGMEHKDIKGWLLSGTNADLYEAKLDEQVFHSGTQSAVLYSTGESNEQQFATLMQEFQSTQYNGKRIRLSCYIKSEKVSKCGAWLRIDNAFGDPVQFDNMDRRSITGTTQWNQYAIVLDVPPESESIHFGVLLIGEGRVWMDGFRFEEVDLNVPVTNMLSKEHLPVQPANLDFSE
ncbi:helix-turn-helix transcriptional regulator [Sporosarcina sp.]|uniref:helix-turn-helix transcriptional regulator n=1 Tax=Sporosarcina sp. TaxID=49982 RepID=UPI002622BE27|nr:AraC family transcriptional regulator [Sporosarcina sp.]